MSEEDKLAWNEYANPLWEKMTNMIETSRNLPKGTMQQYGDSIWDLSVENPETAEIALNVGLVAQIVTREELRHWMFEEFPNEENDKNEYPDAVYIYEYLSTIEEEEKVSKNNHDYFSKIITYFQNKFLLQNVLSNKKNFSHHFFHY